MHNTYLGLMGDERRVRYGYVTELECDHDTEGG